MSKDIHLRLSDEADRELTELAERNGSSITEVIRLAVGLFRIVLNAEQEGNKVIVAKPDGTGLTEVVLPRDENLTESIATSTLT